MKQKLMGDTTAAEATRGDLVIDLMGPDESVLILLKHCRDMKQQETRLRLITLLLLLSCMALILLTTGSVIRQKENSVSSRQGSAVAQSPAYSKQDRVCSADPPNPLASLQRLHIHLRSVPTGDMRDGQYIKWDIVFGEKYIVPEKRAIVIPQTGFYFVYVRIALRCPAGDENFMRFYVELHSWNEGYNKSVSLMEAWDGVVCTPGSNRNVFLGQLFDLLQGDHVSVWIREGYKLIKKSFFGAYLT